MNIICGDSLHVKFPDHVDLILCDPPFMPYKNIYKQIRKENKTNLDTIKTPNSVDQYKDWWDILCSKLPSTEWFCYKSDNYTMFSVHDITLKYFDFEGLVIWDKGRIGLGRRIRKQHELICVYKRKGDKHYWYEGTKSSLKSNWHGSARLMKSFPSILKVPMRQSGVIGQSPQNHINQTPPDLWRYFIHFMCPQEGLVLDPFMGTGSVGIQSCLMGRDYFGVEIENKYVEIARDRIKKMNGQRRLLV